MGYFATSNNLAMAVGPFLGLIVMQHMEYYIIFIITTVLSVIALLTALTIKVSQQPIKREKLKLEFKLGNFFERAAMPIGIFMLVVGLANSSILSFISAYAVEINLVNAASFFFMMYAIFLLLSRPFTGRLFDLRGENIVMYPSILLFGIGLLILSQANAGIFLLIAGGVIGVGFGTLQSSAQTIAVSLVPHRRVGLATATFYTLYDLGMGFGPFIIGYIIPLTGFRNLYLIMAAIAFIAIPIYYFLHGKKANTKERPDHLTF